MGTQVVRIKSASETALELIRRDYPNYHPLVSLARLAHSEAVASDPKLEHEIHKTILPYVAPRLANVEVKSETTEHRRVVVSLFEERQLPDGRSVEVEVPLVTDVTDVVPLD